MTYHVTPINDLEEHDEQGTMCKCSPSVQFENGNMVVVHNSFDGREGLELANEILK